MATLSLVCWERPEELPSVALSLIEIITLTISPTWAMRGSLYKEGGGPELAGCACGRISAPWIPAVSSGARPAPTGEKKGSRMNSLALFAQPVTDIAITSHIADSRGRITISLLLRSRRREEP